MRREDGGEGGCEGGALADAEAFKGGGIEVGVFGSGGALGRFGVGDESRGIEAEDRREGEGDAVFGDGLVGAPVEDAGEIGMRQAVGGDLPQDFRDIGGVRGVARGPVFHGEGKAGRGG